MSGSEKILDRVKRLIALVASPAEEEARNSAWQACKLILEHHFVVRAAGDKGEGDAALKDASFREGYAKAVQDFENEIKRYSIERTVSEEWTAEPSMRAPAGRGESWHVPGYEHVRATVTPAPEREPVVDFGSIQFVADVLLRRFGARLRKVSNWGSGSGATFEVVAGTMHTAGSLGDALRYIFTYIDMKMGDYDTEREELGELLLGEGDPQVKQETPEEKMKSAARRMFELANGKGRRRKVR
jgi:hypothetical protein